jgi:hypothetical protein
MRAEEFLREYDRLYEVDEWFNEATRNALLHNQPLLESLPDYISVNKFVEQYKRVPQVGQSYALMSILFIPIAQVLNVAYTTSMATCVSTKENNTVYHINNNNRVFPDITEKDDLLKVTLLFDSIEERDHVKMLLAVKFGSWRFSTKEIS